MNPNDNDDSRSVALYWDFENLHAGLMETKYGEGEALFDPRPRRTKSGQALTTIDSPRDHSGMSTNTMSFALPEAMRSYVDQRVRSGQYGNTSEYLRELIRRDQEEQAKKRLRELIEEGLNSGPGQALTPQRAAQLKKQALGKRR
jgi:antitoxin ParD1/3/4